MVGTVSQVESELAVKLAWVVVLLLTFSDWLAGVEPLAVAEKDIVVAERLSDACELTVKVTVTVAGEPTAPGAVMVMWPVWVPVAKPVGLTATENVAGVV